MLISRVAVMSRFFNVLLVVVIFGWSHVAFAVSPDYRAAQSAFQRLPEEDRFLVSMMLIAAGYYNGMSTGEFNQRIFSGLTQFQSSIGVAQTGVLDEEQRKRLFQAGSAFYSPLGMKEFTHPLTNAKLFVPTKLIEDITRTRRGLAFEGSTASVDFSFFAAEEATLSDLYARLSAPLPNREIGYKVLRDRFFVVSGGSPERAFYSRYDLGDRGIVGFTLSWAHEVAGGQGGRIAVIMANLFSPRAISAQVANAPASGASSSAPSPTEAKKGSSTGSGFLVSKEAHLLTNAHVVDGCNSIAVAGVGSAKVVALDKTNDLALVQAAAPMLGSPLHMSSKNLRLGEDVVVIGYPLTGILGGVNVTTGIVSALSGIGNDSTRIQFTAPIQPGNSGGPLLDRAGGLAGIVASKLSDIPMIAGAGVVPQNVNFAVRKEMIAAFLSAQGMRLEEAPSSQDLSVADVAEAARSSVFVLECK